MASIDCDSTSLTNNAICLFKCVPPGFLPYMQIAALCNIANGNSMTCDSTTLVDSAKCLECQIPIGMTQYIITYLLCFIAQNGTGGSGGGGGGVTCANAADPVAAPTGTCALYYRSDNGSLWSWSSTRSAWDKLLG